eukprot:5443011-Karenia_brevis.AAC.1
MGSGEGAAVTPLAGIGSNAGAIDSTCDLLQEGLPAQGMPSQDLGAESELLSLVDQVDVETAGEKPSVSPGLI